MRSEAGIANVRSRARRDVDEARLFAVQQFATDVVEAVENLHRGNESLPHRSAHEPEILKRLREGFIGIERSFVGVLERNGIKRQDPTGAKFDAGLHQAMDARQTDSEPPGTVLQAWSSVWTLNGRLLRPAMVVVATAPHGHMTQALPNGIHDHRHRHNGVR
jgi:molecular chaperone GrpE